jgi:hypothetical protein
MHLIVPFAAPTSEPAHALLRGLALPTLRGLLARLGKPALVEENTDAAGDEMSLSTPHERAWARALGWGDLPDGLVPTAAWAARRHGLPALPPQTGWALLTPAHWRLGTEQVSLTDPAGLNLDEAQSRAFFEVVRDLFESEGFGLHWVEPTTWLCSHEQLVDLPTASLDRVIGRNVDHWLGADARARLVRRLQNEVQMLLHEHPLNQAREARGEWPVNSVWLSGCGRLPDTPEALAADVHIHTGLRSAALADDAAAWARAFEAFDAGALADWDTQVRRLGHGSLTLCGERGSLHWPFSPQSSVARLLRKVGLGRTPEPADLLNPL